MDFEESNPNLDPNPSSNPSPSPNPNPNPTPNPNLRKGVFDYVDVDDKGGITQPELAVVVDKFGLKLNDAQLGEYLAEFDTDGDGQISRVEFCSLMAKLQGLVGITANPNLVTKDLQVRTYP